jgi:chemotaxis protein MotB
MRRRSSKGRINHERWQISYADFITLLFAVFVVLYASSKADLKKQSKVAQAIEAAFSSLGVFTGVSSKPSANAAPASGSDTPVVPMNIVMGEDVLSPAQVKQDLNHIKSDLEQRLSNQVAAHTVSIEMGRDGLVISLREAGFFNSGDATPKAGSIPVLRQIALSLANTPYDMRIEGHTDNVPIHTGEFDSNWELSSARATRIARIFLNYKTVPAERLSAAGYAEFHPVASNDSAEGRARNRRVDLVILPRSKIDFTQPEANGASQTTRKWRKITDKDPVVGQ